MTELVLSLFPGIGLLDRGFEEEGYCVVRGPDLLWGGDIRRFHPPANRFSGIIGGPPCQDFSKARRNLPPSGDGVAMLAEFVRVTSLASPTWWLLENVPSVPDVTIPDYITQRFDLNAAECGGNQSRLRHFQFGSRDGRNVTPLRLPKPSVTTPACLASDGKRGNRRAWREFCEAQGLPSTFDLPGFTIQEKYRAVGNGVPVYMARVVARAIKGAMCDHPENHASHLCECGCGRSLAGMRGDARLASPACRKRMQRRRDKQP